MVVDDLWVELSRNDEHDSHVVYSFSSQFGGVDVGDSDGERTGEESEAFNEAKLHSELALGDGLDASYELLDQVDMVAGWGG